MKRQISIGLVIFVMLVVTPSLALGAQFNEAGLMSSAFTPSAANAPWFINEVDTLGGAGQFPSLAIDPQTSRIYVSYYDPGPGDLRMARYVRTGGNCGPNNSWSCQTVDSEGDVGKYSSIAAYGGLVMIAYHDASSGDLKFASSSNSIGWLITTIDKEISPNSTGLFTSMIFVWPNVALISYFSNESGVDELKMASFVLYGGGNCGYGVDAGHWQCDTIQTGDGVGQYSSLALDGNGDTHIAYYDAVEGDLWYATSTSGINCVPGGNTWLCYPVTGLTTDAGKYASMYVDDGGHYHIAYYDATNDTLNYAVDVGSGGNCGVLGSAQCDEIDSMQADYHPLGISIAEDAAGYPIIAYQSYNGSLNVARPVAALGLSGGGGNCGPVINLFYTWYCETIDRSGTWITYRNADYVSIAVAPSGLATIAYYGFVTSTGGNMYVATQRLPLQVFLPLTVKDG